MLVLKDSSKRTNTEQMLQTDKVIPPEENVGALSEHEIATMTESEAFREWAGEDWRGAGGVLSDGETLTIYYHGGNPDIPVFNRDNPRRTGAHEQGIYFSPRVDDARFYADNLAAEKLEEGLEPEASIYAVALKMHRPLITETTDMFSSASMAEVPRDAEGKQYDGVINPKSQEVVVFDPSQVYIIKEMSHRLHRKVRGDI